MRRERYDYGQNMSGEDRQEEKRNYQRGESLGRENIRQEEKGDLNQ